MIQNQDVYKMALAQLSLSPTASGNEDLAERAPYHLASFCTEAAEIHRIYLSHTEEEEPSEPSYSVYLALEQSFPLPDRFVPAAALYLSAMLILDEDPERSDRLYHRYAEAMTEILGEVLSPKDTPGVSTPIVDRYYAD